MVRVLVLGDDPLARSGLLSILAGHDGITVTSQLAAADDLAFHELQADVAVWDLGPTAARGTDAIQGVQRAGIRVLALVAGEPQARDAWAAGASGILFRDVEAGALASAVLAVARGLVVLEADVADALRPARHPASAAPVEALTARELEVLQLLSEGLSNKAIADRLGISDHTAKFHVNAILGKLGARSRTEAIVQAARLGLVIL